MMRINEALLPVAVEAVILFVLSRVLFTEVVSSFADARGKGFWLGVLRLPGNVVHEVSHAVGFVVCGYRVKRLLLCVFDRAGCGSCTPGRPWSPITLPHLAVGIAALMPLVTGSLVLMLAGRWLGVATGLPGETAAALLPQVWQQALALLSDLNWHHWQTWVFLYLALSIGAELSPSSADLRWGVPTLLLLAGGVWLGLFALHHTHHLPGLEHKVTTAVVQALTRGGSVLGLAVIFTTVATVVTLVPALVVRALRRR